MYPKHTIIVVAVVSTLSRTTMNTTSTRESLLLALGFLLLPAALLAQHHHHHHHPYANLGVNSIIAINGGSGHSLQFLSHVESSTSTINAITRTRSAIMKHKHIDSNKTKETTAATTAEPDRNRNEHYEYDHDHPGQQQQQQQHRRRRRRDLQSQEFDANDNNNVVVGPPEFDEYLDRCTTRREFLVEFASSVLGTTCGPCYFDPIINGYRLSCPQSCDECYNTGDGATTTTNNNICARGNDVISVFNELTDPINGGIDRICKQVATETSPYYGIEYCMDASNEFDFFCETSINGYPCESCYMHICPNNGILGANVDCTNVIPNTYYDQCAGRAGGVFEFEIQLIAAAQSMPSSFNAQCPSLLEQIPPPVSNTADIVNSYVPPSSPWQCGPLTGIANEDFTCVNRDDPTAPLDMSIFGGIDVWFYYQCPFPITDQDPVTSCGSSCIIAVFNDDGSLDNICRSCTVLEESGDIAYNCENVLPDIECPVKDEDSVCRVWDCQDRTEFVDIEDGDFVYSCTRIGNPGYPLDDDSIAADTTFLCHEPLGNNDEPTLDNCSFLCLVRDTSFPSEMIDDSFCEICMLLPDGGVAYDCFDIFPDMDCPVKAPNGMCWTESQPRAFCAGSQRLDGRWICFDKEEPSRGLDPDAGTRTFFSCESSQTFFINLEECLPECYILFIPEDGDEDFTDTADGINCDSCTLLPNGEIAYDCRNLLVITDYDCPARNENGDCYIESISESGDATSDNGNDGPGSAGSSFVGEPNTACTSTTGDDGGVDVFAKTSVEECEAKCKEDDSCGAIEVNFSGRCELWRREIKTIDGAVGFTCMKRQNWQAPLDASKSSPMRMAPDYVYVLPLFGLLA